MRTWIIAFALLAACKGNKDGNKAATQPAAKQPLAVPKVATAAVLATDEKPPFLLLLDAKGTLHVSAAASWTDVATKDLMVGAKTADPDKLWVWMREAHGLGKPPREALAAWDPKAEVSLDTLEDKTPRTNPAVGDDPPPPEDDGADESGGTGTAMALEEGHMGKQDADPKLARKRQAGHRGASAFAGMRDADKQGFGPGDGRPSRAYEVAGEVIEDGKLSPTMLSALIVAPTTPAPKLIEIITQFNPAIVVAHGTTVRPLRLQFMPERDAVWDDPKYWLEARVTAKGVTIEAVPDAPIELATLDPKELAAALEKARTTRGAEKFAPVDVLVDPTLDAQRLVDVIAALDQAGARMIGLGLMPKAEELALRGKRIPTTMVGQPNAQGDLDKALIRRVVKSNLENVHACYVEALAKNATAAGTVVVQFFITPKGKVVSSSASGVDPALATCVADSIKKLQFPEPKGGGGVQVVYPFTFRP